MNAGRLHFCWRLYIHFDEQHVLCQTKKFEFIATIFYLMTHDLLKVNALLMLMSNQFTTDIMSEYKLEYIKSYVHAMTMKLDHEKY